MFACRPALRWTCTWGHRVTMTALLRILMRYSVILSYQMRSVLQLQVHQSSLSMGALKAVRLQPQPLVKIFLFLPRWRWSRSLVYCHLAQATVLLSTTTPILRLPSSILARPHLTTKLLSLQDQVFHCLTLLGCLPLPFQLALWFNVFLLSTLTSMPRPTPTMLPVLLQTLLHLAPNLCSHLLLCITTLPLPLLLARLVLLPWRSFPTLFLGFQLGPSLVLTQWMLFSTMPSLSATSVFIGALTKAALRSIQRAHISKLTKGLTLGRSPINVTGKAAAGSLPDLTSWRDICASTLESSPSNAHTARELLLGQTTWPCIWRDISRDCIVWWSSLHDFLPRPALRPSLMHPSSPQFVLPSQSKTLDMTIVCDCAADTQHAWPAGLVARVIAGCHSVDVAC